MTSDNADSWSVLQSAEGPVRGDVFVTSQPDKVLWGFLPNREQDVVATVDSGDLVTFDTVSHEGILEDQGRDPVSWFGERGVSAYEVLDDAAAIAASSLPHEDEDGPHVVTGPVAVTTAQPGDVLQIDVVDLTPRAPYGVISNRHGRGCLAGEFPEDTERSPNATAAEPWLYGSRFTFTRVELGRRGPVGVLPFGGGRSARFPLAPFLGIMGVASDTSDPVPSVPPGNHGGNIDVKLAVVGSTLYLPVQVPGAGFFVGDPHYAQGNGEVALTALEAPLRATVRLSVLHSEEARAVIGAIRFPFFETDDFWVPVGLHQDLDEAMRQATRAAVSFLETRLGMPRADALAYLSAAADFEVSQVVDATKGVHCRIRKADFDPV